MTNEEHLENKVQRCLRMCVRVPTNLNVPNKLKTKTLWQSVKKHLLPGGLGTCQVGGGWGGKERAGNGPSD